MQITHQDKDLAYLYAYRMIVFSVKIDPDEATLVENSVLVTASASNLRIIRPRQNLFLTDHYVINLQFRPFVFFSW